MKSILLSLFITVSVYTGVFAQERVNVDIKQDANIEKILSRDIKMFFPEFRNAIVYLKSSRTQALMNWNILSGKMMFIDKSNDTLALSNEREVLMIVFDQQKFIYIPKGFVEILANAEDTILGLQTSLQHTGNQKYGAYGMVTNTSAIANITTVTSVNTATESEINVLSQAGFQKKKFYYLVIGKKYQTANQNAFLKIFGKKKNQIKEYLQQNPVDYNKEEDLIQLFNFCVKQ